jgi:Tol biopolymer transport system component/DNA-binding winged helix-turn-helix (wHTH) protein
VTVDPDSPSTFAFGPYRLSVEERTLLRDGVPVPLFPKAFDILVVLVEKHGRLVTKEELLRRVWPDTFVQESNLSQHIHLLRKALGEGEDQSVIQTVPRQGYRFTASVHEPEAEVIVTHRSTTRVVIEEEVTEDRPPQHSRRGSLLLAGVLACGVLVGTAALLRSGSSAGDPVAAPGERPPHARMERLTTDSRSHEPAISPDGRFVAYRIADAGHHSVWLKNIATGSAVEILPRSERGYHSLNFSRDGNEILYKTARGPSDRGTVLRVPVFGGAAKEVATNVWSDFSVSPDGTEIAFVRPNASKQPELVAASVTLGQERVIATVVEQQDWLDVEDTSPSWSPDGRRIVVCGAWRDPSRGLTFGLFEAPAGGGPVKRLPSPGWNRVSQVAYLGDGSGLVVVGRSKQRDPYQVWILELPSGAVRRITNDLNDYNKVRVSRDGNVIAVEQQLAFQELWVGDANGAETPRQISHGSRSLDGFYGLSWTPDGRILFASSRSGESEIYTCKPDGSELRALTRESREWNTNARMTSDGRTIVFSSGRNGEANIWRMDADGGNVVQLTHGKSEFSPTLSPDGRWVYYVNAHVPPSRIERIPIDGGSPEVVFEGEAAEVPAVSPDGKWIAFGLYSDATGWRAAVLPLDGGRRRIFDWYGARGFVRWSPDSRNLLFVKAQGNVSNVWAQPLEGGAPYPVTTFEERSIWNFAPSPDGKHFAFSRGSSVSEIVLLRDFE